jgi:hypothetical protein
LMLIDPDPPLLGEIQIATGQRRLDFGGVAHRIDDTREFRQQAIAGSLDDAPDSRGFSVPPLRAMRIEALRRSSVSSSFVPIRNIGPSETWLTEPMTTRT